MQDYPGPIDPNLLTIGHGGKLALKATRHPETGKIIYPILSGQTPGEEIELPREGSLWSWTVQRFRPKSPPYTGPDNFTPYAVGYIDLGEIIVESRLVGVDFDKLNIGMEMTLVEERFETAGGETLSTFAFAPSGEI